MTQTKTFLESSITISATILNGILGLIFFILLARTLGPESLGIFTFTIAVITLVADIANLGTDTGIIRFIGKYKNSGEEKKFLKLGLELKILTWAIVFFIGWFSAPFIAESFFSKTELIFPLRLSLIGIGGALLYSFITSALQAYQKYRAFSYLMIGTNMLRLFLVIMLIFASALSMKNALITYMVIPFFGFFVGLFVLPHFLSAKNEWGAAKDFFHYNKWIALISIVAVTGSRLDTFLLTRLLTVAEVGIYSIALQLTSFIPQIFFALAAVAAPKLASFDKKSKAIAYFKKLQLLTFGMALAGILGIPLGVILIPILYGNSYAASVIPFIILLFGQLLFLLSLPYHQVIYYFYSKPRILFFVSILETLVIAISGLILIPVLGILGASISIFLGGTVILLIPAIWVSYHLFYKNE